MMQKTAILELRSKGYSFPTIARTIGCTEGYARNVCCNASLTRNNNDSVLMASLYQSGTSLYSIAQKFELTESEVIEALKLAGVVVRRKPTSDTNKAILQLVNEGVSERRICEALGVSRSKVCNVKQRSGMYGKRGTISSIPERAPQILRDIGKLREQGYSIRDACETIGISTTTFYEARRIIEKEAP
jgi:transposase-like protein